MKESMADMERMLSLNADCVITSFSDSLKEMLGYSADEVIGRNISVLLPEVEKECKDFFNAAKDRGETSGIRKKLLHKNGRIIDAYVSIYALGEGSGIYAYILTLNAEKDPASPAILSEEFKKFFMFSNDSVAITDKGGHIIDVNQTFLDTYGYSRQEVLGKNPRVLKSTHSSKELYERMWKDILDPDKGFWRGEIINLRKDGAEVAVILSINAIKSHDGAIKNFLGIAVDISRRKEMEKLNRMYIDYIVHDMRGPLTAIMANSELMLIQLRNSLQAKDMKKIEAILSSARRLERMNTDILDYSRIHNNKIVLVKERVSLAKVFKEAISPYEHADKKLFMNGLAYNENLLSGREIVSDGDKLQRIIYNLLSNAFKSALKEVRLSVDYGDEELMVTVSNDGRGISVKDAERIFDAFYHTEEGVKTGGAGLGLSIVKNFTELLGGRVWVESAGGGSAGGATFGVSIPIAG